MALKTPAHTNHDPVALRSCFYECDIVHERFTPKRHRFRINTFLFAIDLDDVPNLVKHLPGFGLQWWQPFRWVDTDWMPLKLQSNFASHDLTLTLKDRVMAFMAEHGFDISQGRVVWIGQPRVFGFGYNPASFFICWNAKNQPVATILMVDNTFRELKPFIIPASNSSQQSNGFYGKLTKFFYISPFLNLDDEFECRISLPEEQFNVTIETQRNGELLLKAGISGKRRPLSGYTLWMLSLRYPLFPQFTLMGIHWHALLLYFKRIGFHPKEANLHLQRGFLTPQQR